MAHDNINNAITLYWSILVTDDTKNQIITAFGDEILAEIDRIMSYAVNNPIWANIDHLISHRQTIEELKKEYPFLTNSSLIKIADTAAYFWKNTE